MKEKPKHLNLFQIDGISFIVFLFILTTQTTAISAQPQVAGGQHHTVGLKTDGTVVAVGLNDFDLCEEYNQ